MLVSELGGGELGAAAVARVDVVVARVLRELLHRREPDVTDSAFWDELLALPTGDSLCCGTAPPE